ncbi:MAG TPA: hypothetical protein VIM65_02180 [Cyclobacteriaceae bacterium]
MSTLNTNEQLITRLLQQALTMHRIMDGLGKLGFHNDGTYDEIGGIVFDLMGYRETENSNEWSDSFFDTYLKFLHSIDSRRLNDKGFMQKSAVELYRQLKSIRIPLNSDSIAH